MTFEECGFVEGDVITPIFANKCSPYILVGEKYLLRKLKTGRLVAHRFLDEVTISFLDLFAGSAKWKKVP